jgi:hypothetical protein
MILLGLIALISKYLYNQFKESEDMFETNEHYNLVSEFFLEQGKKRKPILWIHSSTELNSRNWDSFMSRSSNKLNQPYLQLTMKSIYDHCKESFNICLINDDSFSSLLSWNLDLPDIAEPMKSHYRTLGLSMILYEYGGMLVPQSFLCTKNLLPLYKPIFFMEQKNTGISEHVYLPNTLFMGCKKKNPTMKRFIAYQEQLYKERTEQSDFIGNTQLWLYRERVGVDGKWIGIKKACGKPVLIDELLGTSEICLPEHYGIYIPQEEILRRPKYSWFARMSVQQLKESQFYLDFGNLLNHSNK